MNFTLDVYSKDKKTVEKTYECESYSLFYGVVNDIIGLIEPGMFSGELKQEEMALAVTKLVIASNDEIKALLKDVFEGLTDDELNRVKVPDMIRVIMNIIIYSIKEIKGLSNGKNV